MHLGGSDARTIGSRERAALVSLLSYGHPIHRARDSTVSARPVTSGRDLSRNRLGRESIRVLRSPRNIDKAVTLIALID